MTKESIDLAARELVAARRERRLIDRLPESCRPQGNEAALAIQRSVLEQLNENIGGWKCALPKGEQVSLAPLPASTIGSSMPFPILPHKGMVRIEPEVAFIIGKDLQPRETAYTDSDIHAAIGEARLVLEIIGSRFADTTKITHPESLADSVNNQALFLGPPAANVFKHQLDSLRITISTPAGTLITHDGRHPSGHPLRALLWLANFLSACCETLKAGCVVTTGSYAGVLEVPLETPLSVSYGDLGKLEVTFERG
jgi:2-keto-4-pentenoate hydratase